MIADRRMAGAIAGAALLAFCAPASAQTTTFAQPRRATPGQPREILDLISGTRQKI